MLELLQVQKAEVEQAKKKELADAYQKLSEKEQEIKKIEEEVSLGLEASSGCFTSSCWLQKAKVEQRREDAEQKLSEKEQEIKKITQEVNPVFGVLRRVYNTLLNAEDRGRSGEEKEICWCPAEPIRERAGDFKRWKKKLLWGNLRVYD